MRAHAERQSRCSTQLLKSQHITITTSVLMFTILRGHAVSHSEIQVHPDSFRESIYTEARAEWDIKFSG